MARAIVARQHHRFRLAGGRAQAEQALAHRAVKAEQFGQRFGFDAQRNQNGAEFEFGHAAVEHGAEQLMCVLL